MTAEIQSTFHAVVMPFMHIDTHSVSKLRTYILCTVVDVYVHFIDCRENILYTVYVLAHSVGNSAESSVAGVFIPVARPRSVPRPEIKCLFL